MHGVNLKSQTIFVCSLIKVSVMLPCIIIQITFALRPTHWSTAALLLCHSNYRCVTIMSYNLSLGYCPVIQFTAALLYCHTIYRWITFPSYNLSLRYILVIQFTAALLLSHTSTRTVIHCHT